MIITADALKGIFSGYSMAFNKGVTGAASVWPSIAMKVQSGNADETYGWLETLPHMREWLGGRVTNGLKASGYTIVNRTFENDERQVYRVPIPLRSAFSRYMLHGSSLFQVAVDALADEVRR